MTDLYSVDIQPSNSKLTHGTLGYFTSMSLATKYMNLWASNSRKHCLKGWTQNVSGEWTHVITKERLIISKLQQSLNPEYTA